VQIETRRRIFQLGFVNLPSAEIPGVGAEFAFSMNEQLAARRRGVLERCADDGATI
jgi:hypothetical protein